MYKKYDQPFPIGMFDLDHELVDLFCDGIESLFVKKFKLFYSSFCEVNELILSNTKVLSMVNDYNSTCPHHYDMMNIIFNVKLNNYEHRTVIWLMIYIMTNLFCFISCPSYKKGHNCVEQVMVASASLYSHTQLFPYFTEVHTLAL